MKVLCQINRSQSNCHTKSWLTATLTMITQYCQKTLNCLELMWFTQNNLYSHRLAHGLNLHKFIHNSVDQEVFSLIVMRSRYQWLKEMTEGKSQKCLVKEQSNFKGQNYSPSTLLTSVWPFIFLNPLIFFYSNILFLFIFLLFYFLF